MAHFSIAGHEIAAAPLDPGLYVVATPIGNLADITIRALHVLAAADVIACEDKRISTRLLNHYGIRAASLLPYHEHNEHEAGAKLLELLRMGARVALISDAGTPLISDPGFRLVRAARAEGIGVWPVPGPNAAVAALSASGMATDNFCFHGFLPARKNARLTRLKDLAGGTATSIFYESPARLPAALADIAEQFGKDRLCCVYREISKMHEEMVSGSAGDLARRFAAGEKPRGEIVILVEGARQEPAEVDADSLLRELLRQMSVSRAAAEAALLTGIPRRQLYQRALQLSRPVGEQPGE